jgi:hypothetical protein
MENNLLEDFQRELTQIKEYIKHIQQVNDLADVEIPDEPVFSIFKEHFLSFQTNKKVFEYKAIVISLYGLLEKYIEFWIQEYLRNLSALISYNNLSDNIRNKHFELSLKLISVVAEGRQAKYNHLIKENILKKLNNCIESSTNYEFNAEAFTMQAGNLTHSRIEEIFKMIDIANIGKELIKNDELVAMIGINPNQVQNTETNILFGKINELVERRNIIAHGAVIDDLLGLSELEPFIEFLEKYCMAIFSALKEKHIENHTVEKYREIRIIAVYNKQIIAFSLENYEIKVGDWVIIKTAEQGNERFYKKEIKTLGKDGKNDYQELTIKESANIAIGIDNKEQLPITQNCTFYLEKR